MKQLLAALQGNHWPEFLSSGVCFSLDAGRARAVGAAALAVLPSSHLPGHHPVPSEGNYHLAELPLKNTNTWLPGQHLTRVTRSRWSLERQLGCHGNRIAAASARGPGF